MPLKSYTSSAVGSDAGAEAGHRVVEDLGELLVLGPREVLEYGHASHLLGGRLAGLHRVQHFRIHAEMERARDPQAHVVEAAGPFCSMRPASVSANVRGAGSSKMPRLASARITRYSASSLTPVCFARSATGTGPAAMSIGDPSLITICKRRRCHVARADLKQELCRHFLGPDAACDVVIGLIVPFDSVASASREGVLPSVL